MKTAILSFAFVGACVAACAQPAFKTVDVFGQKIQYVEAGSGPNVILLHGLGGDWSNWQFNVPALSPKYHVWALDQIGFGGSDKPFLNYRTGTLVDFLEGFCAKLSIDHATVVGNSLGGWAAMAFTLAHPERVSKLVLVDSAGYSFANSPVPPPTRDVMLGLNPSTLAGAKGVLAVIFAHESFVTDANARNLFEKHLKNNDGYTINAFIDSMLRGEDFLDGKLGGIRVPTLVLWGRADRLTSLASGEQFAKDIQGAQMTVLDGCGHVPQMECAVAFNAALLKFLGAESASR